MAFPSVAYPGAEPLGEGFPRAQPVRQSKLNYGQELRAQMEADVARKQQQQRAAPSPAGEQPAIGIIPRGRPAFSDASRLPGIRGATPVRPRSRRTNAGGDQRGSHSPQQREEQPPQPPSRFGNEEGGAGQKVLEQEVQHLTHQVQELLVGLHGRVLMLEQDLSGTRRDKDQLIERLQGLEMDNVALRAEIKVLAPRERVANLERDMAQKLHAHLEHVTSVESERVAAALQRMHQLQLDAQEERRKNEVAQEAIQQQQHTIGSLEERLRVVESSESVNLRQQSQEYEARQMDGARMEVRVNELEAALRALSVKGEQVVRDTGNAMKNMVENSSASILSQLQFNVNALSTQMKAVEHELLQRGTAIAHRTEEEGQQRVRSLAELEKSMHTQVARIQSELTDVRDSRLVLEAQIREVRRHTHVHTLNSGIAPASPHTCAHSHPLAPHGGWMGACELSPECADMPYLRLHEFTIQSYMSTYLKMYLNTYTWTKTQKFEHKQTYIHVHIHTYIHKHIYV